MERVRCVVSLLVLAIGLGCGGGGGGMVPAVVGIVSTVPADNATNVLLTAVIQVTFNQAMNKPATQGAFSIAPNVAGTFWWSGDAKVMTFVPNSALTAATQYTVTISTAAKSAAGGGLAAPYVFKFTTVPPPADTTPPVFAGLTTATPQGSSSILLSWTAATDDASPANQLIYRVCQSSLAGACAAAFSVTYTTSPGATSFTVGGLSQGVVYCFIVRAEDQAGNREVNTVEKCALIPTGGDTTAPTVSVTNPAANATLSGTATLEATAFDNSGFVSKVEFFVVGFSDAVCEDAVPKPSGSVFSCNWDTTTIGNGSYQIRGRATDPSNNSTQSDPISFTVNNAVPAGAVVVQGLLQLPPPLNPADFVVGNVFQTVIPDSAGHFSIPVREAGVTVTAAVPKTYTEGENVWMAVLLKFPDRIVPAQPGPEVVINADSTAKAMIVMHLLLPLCENH